jgi:hypothetical protein
MSTATRLVLKLKHLTEEQQQRVIEFIDQLPASLPNSPRPLYGLFKGYDTTEEDIAEARREMWGRFSHEDE